MAPKPLQSNRKGISLVKDTKTRILKCYHHLIARKTVNKKTDGIEKLLIRQDICRRVTVVLKNKTILLTICFSSCESEKYPLEQLRHKSQSI